MLAKEGFMQLVNLLVIGTLAQMERGSAKVLSKSPEIVQSHCISICCTWDCLRTIILIHFTNFLQVYVTKDGQELSGQIAYRRYKKVAVLCLLFHTCYKPKLCIGMQFSWFFFSLFFPLELY